MRDTVLLHELAHHLADGTGTVRLPRGAGPALPGPRPPGRGALLARGFEHLEGLPDPDADPPGRHDDQLRRVAALLAKAESTTHPEEAEAYLARAAILAQRHSIDLAVAALSASRPTGVADPADDLDRRAAPHAQRAIRGAAPGHRAGVGRARRHRPVLDLRDPLRDARRPRPGRSRSTPPRRP